MLEVLTRDTSAFMPHGHCFLWTPGLLWTYVASDVTIGLAYYSIPVALTYFVRKRKDFSFNWIFVMFAIFIFACGTTHFMAVWNIWHPDYWLDAAIKLATAAVSIATAVLVWPLIPTALALPSSEQMNKMNRELQSEVAVRRQAEIEIKELNAELERRVQQRTLELEQSNRELEKQNAERRRAELELQEVNANLQRTVERLAQRSRETSLLRELGDMLQTCNSADECSKLVSRYVLQLFPKHSGALFRHEAQTDVFATTATWGTMPPTQHVITASDCWALRRGKQHVIKGEDASIACKHLPDPSPYFSVCIPLAAHGELLGLLHVHADDRSHADGDYHMNAMSQVAESIAERASLALADIKLVDSLRNQAIRDPLTGLYNRRFMEETLHREQRRAERGSESIGILMLDIDQFKHFNDTYGHQAGDAMMRELGRVLKSLIRGGDLACRYGGDEFVIILPESTPTVARQRAEQLRAAIVALRLMDASQGVDQVTVSIGVANFPENGPTWEAVLSAADKALYAAKQAGRNRVATAPDAAA